MGRWSRVTVVLAAGMLVAGCSPTLAGPELPRPAQTRVRVTTTTLPATTTTLDRRTILTTQCPTEVCLVYTIAPEARWSDGEPVTAADFAATVTAYRDPLAGPEGSIYELVASVDVVDSKTVRVALAEPYGAWQGLFSRVVPAHVRSVEPDDMLSSGPFVFEEWIDSDRIVLVRNEEWWAKSDPLSGEPAGTVERIEFVFIADAEELLEAIESGAVDVIAMRPAIEVLERLSGFPETVTFTMAPGPFWEHIDFHHDDGLLAQGWVRRALDLAIDREEILDRTVRLLVPGTAALDNTLWMTESVDYEVHYEDRYDPEAAEELLVEHGCVRGEDGIYVCDGDPMSFTWVSTNDDVDRREIVDSVREDLAQIGVEILPDLRSPSSFVTREVLFGGADVWQFVNFSWVTGSDPSASDGRYLCGDSDLNVNRYCSPEVEQLVLSARATMDPTARAELYNRADRLYLEDLALIPLYQKPELLAWSSALSGPSPNFTTSTDLWNVGSWRGPATIVVALPFEPVSLDPLSTADESANWVLSTMMYGAYGMTPSQEHLPVLVESVDIVEG